MKFNMQTASSQIKTLSLIAVAMLLGVSQTTWAAGTPSGTNIDNSATLNYSVGTIGQPAVTSDGDTATAGIQPTRFVVDNKINLTVIEGPFETGFKPVVPGQTAAFTSFTVTNNGNTVQDYNVAGSATGVPGTVFTVADNFDATACITRVETDNVAGYTAADTATFIDELAPDASKVVYVVCNIPTTQINNDQSNVELTVTTLAGGAAGIGGAVSQAAPNTQGAVEIVFADPATAASTDGTIPLQIARDAIGVARDAFRVVSATLAVTKTVTPVCDPFNGNAAPKNIPGAAVQYAITIVNTGGTAASLTTLVDTLTATLAFDPKLNGGAVAGAGCVPGAGSTNSLSATGFGAVTGVGGVTTYAAPGLVAQAVTAGATVAGQVVTVNFPTLAGGGLTGWTGSLAAGSFITVYFNAFVQ